MRLASARFRTFVHATENEERVRDTLLWTMAILGQDRAEDRVERRRLKGHYGNDILQFEAALTSEERVRASLAHLLSEPETRAAVRETLRVRLDEDNVLHLRLDKQAAVERRVRLEEAGDAIVILAKGVPAPRENPVTAWAHILEHELGGPA